MSPVEVSGVAFKKGFNIATHAWLNDHSIDFNHATEETLWLYSPRLGGRGGGGEWDGSDAVTTPR